MAFVDIVALCARMMRSRIVPDVLAGLGIAAGVALMYLALVASGSLTGSIQQLTSGIVGESQYQLAARSSDGFDDALIEDVAQLPGVRGSAPILEVRTMVGGPRGEQSVVLVGGDPRLARLGGPLLRLFTSSRLSVERAIALPAPVAEAIGVVFGEPVSIITGARRTSSPLGAQLTESDIGSLIHSPVAIAPLDYAQRLAGLPGRVTRIFVQARSGAAGLVRSGLEDLSGGRLNVLDARADIGVFEQAAMPTNQSTALFSLFAAGVGFLFALSAVLLTVPQRRAFIRVLRMSGHSSATVVKALLFDAFVLGSAGSILGLVLGDVLSRQLFASVPGYLAFAFPVGSQRVVSWSSIAIPVCAGLVAASIAVLSPFADIFSRRPVRRPSQTPSARNELRRAAAASAFVAAAAFVLLLAPAAAIAGLVLLTFALLLVLPLLVDLVVGAVLAVGQFGRSAVPVLAASELRSRRSGTRVFALAATGAIAVFASVTIGGAHRDLQRGLDVSASQIDGNADVWATFPGAPNAFATTAFKVSPVTLQRVRSVAGVADATLYRGGFLDIGDRRTWILAPPADAPRPIPARQLVDGDERLATARVRAGGWVVVSKALADQEHVKVGDLFDLSSPRPIPLRIAALSTNLGWPPGAMILNAQDYARAWGSAEPSGLQIRTMPGANGDDVAQRVQAALGPTSAVTETMRDREHRHNAAAREGLERLTHISALVLGAAIIAMATAMGGFIWQRRPVLAQLKVHGRSTNELWSSLLLESAILLGTGCFVGAAFGLGGQLMLSRALWAVTGFPVFYSTGFGVAATILLVVVIVALLLLAIPGRIAASVRPSPRPAS